MTKKKTTKNWEKEFERTYNTLHKDGIIYGEDGTISVDKEGSQLGSIKTFIQDLLDQRTREVIDSVPRVGTSAYKIREWKESILEHFNIKDDEHRTI